MPQFNSKMSKNQQFRALATMGSAYTHNIMFTWNHLDRGDLKRIDAQ